MIKQIESDFNNEHVKKEILEFFDILKMLHSDCKEALKMFHNWRRKVLKLAENYNDRSLKSKTKKHVKKLEAIFMEELNQKPEYYNYIHHLNY